MFVLPCLATGIAGDMAFVTPCTNIGRPSLQQAGRRLCFVCCNVRPRSSCGCQQFEMLSFSNHHLVSFPAPKRPTRHKKHNISILYNKLNSNKHAGIISRSTLDDSPLPARHKRTPTTHRLSLPGCAHNGIHEQHQNRGAVWQGQVRREESDAGGAARQCTTPRARFHPNPPFTTQAVCGDMGLSSHQGNRRSQAGAVEAVCAECTADRCATGRMQPHPLRLHACVCTLQELKSLIADDCVFKADGVLYTEDMKGEQLVDQGVSHMRSHCWQLHYRDANVLTPAHKHTRTNTSLLHTCRTRQHPACAGA